MLSKVFSIKNFEVNFKNIKNEKKLSINFIKLFFIAFLKKIFFSRNSFFENFFFNKRWLEKIIKKLEIK